MEREFETNHQLLTYDPSKYAVYQMAEYVLQGSNKKLVQKTFPNMLLSKITPFQDDLYNYAYLFEEEISEDILSQIQMFFENEKFRICFSKSSDLNSFLSQH
jgi:hypothetical protein